MAATRTKSHQASPNGVISKPAAKAKEAGETVTEAAGRAKGPLAAAGVAAALAGGFVLGRAGSKRVGLFPRRRKVLGLRIGPKTGLERTADVLEKLADGLGSVAGQASSTTDDVHKIRDQLEQANRQSPVEVLLDGLTHRRGAHKREK
jgi:hypothetical protein